MLLPKLVCRPGCEYLAKWFASTRHAIPCDRSAKKNRSRTVVSLQKCLLRCTISPLRTWKEGDVIISSFITTTFRRSSSRASWFVIYHNLTHSDSSIFIEIVCKLSSPSPILLETCVTTTVNDRWCRGEDGQWPLSCSLPRYVVASVPTRMTPVDTPGWSFCFLLVPWSSTKWPGFLFIPL